MILVSLALGTAVTVLIIENVRLRNANRILLSNFMKSLFRLK